MLENELMSSRTFIIIQLSLQYFVMYKILKQFNFSISTIIDQRIKPKKIVGSKFQPKEIAKKFSIQITPEDTDEIIRRKYMDMWARSFEENKWANIKELLEDEKKLKFIQFTKLEICKSESFDDRTEKIINNFFGAILSSLNNSKIFALSNSQLKIWETEFLEIVSSINHFAYFMKKDKKFCFNYMNLMLFINGKARIHGSYDFNTQLKQILDCLIEIPKEQFNLQEATFAIRFISSFNLNVWYYKKSDLINKILWNNVPERWENVPFSRVHLMASLSSLGITSQSIIKKLWKITRSTDNKSKIFAVKLLLRRFQINKQNCNQPSIKSLIQNLINEDAQIFFKKTIGEMYRARIWIPEYWIPFFNFAMKNYSIFSLYDIFALLQVMKIDQQKMDLKIYELMKQLEKTVKKQYKEISIHDIQKQYDTRYSSYLSKVNCQSQIANSLRLISKSQVRTQVFVGIFNVDILIKDKYVIEVNGGSHYITDIQTGKKTMNLKTQFRQEMLPLMGYHIFNINVEQMNEGSFGLIEKIYKWMQEKQKEQELKKEQEHS